MSGPRAVLGSRRVRPHKRRRIHLDDLLYSWPLRAEDGSWSVANVRMHPFWPQPMSAICLGVSNHSRVAQRPWCRLSALSLHNPPFFIRIEARGSPVTHSEINPL